MKAIGLIFLVLLCVACKKDRGVDYKVTCASCDLTYSDSKGNTKQTSMTSSWSLSFEADEDQFLYLSAQNNNQTGTVSVSIKCAGKTIDDASSSGAYVIATASGSAP